MGMSIRTANTYINVWLNGQESAEDIVPKGIYLKGRVEHSMFFYTERLLSKVKRTASPCKINQDLPKEYGVELRSTMGESSFASVLPDEKERITMDTG